jgi:hypothetical protein
MSRTPRDESHPSGRAAEAIGRFVTFVSALDEGRLRQADHAQLELRRIGFNVTVRPLGSPFQPGGSELC